MQVYTGIDWSENKHDVLFMNEKGAVISYFHSSHSRWLPPVRRHPQKTRSQHRRMFGRIRDGPQHSHRFPVVAEL